MWGMYLIYPVFYINNCWTWRVKNENFVLGCTKCVISWSRNNYQLSFYIILYNIILLYFFLFYFILFHFILFSSYSFLSYFVLSYLSIHLISFLEFKSTFYSHLFLKKGDYNLSTISVVLLLWSYECSSCPNPATLSLTYYGL